MMKDRVLYLKDKSNRLIARVEMKKNMMYKLDLKIVQERCLKLDVKDEAMMWHFRFGHLHFCGLAELVKKEMVRKSTSEYVFFMGSTMFTWLSKKQPIVTLSTCETEYVAASWSVYHAVWLRNLISKLELKQEKGTVIRVDNKSAIELAKNPVNHERSKHIDVRFHFI